MPFQNPDKEDIKLTQRKLIFQDYIGIVLYIVLDTFLEFHKHFEVNYKRLPAKMALFTFPSF